MARYSKTQKKVEETVLKAPRRPRKKREVKLPPAPFKIGSPVMVTAPDEFKGIKAGIIFKVCKDGGMNVFLTNPRIKGVAEYVCIHTDRGHTIELIQ